MPTLESMSTVPVTIRSRAGGPDASVDVYDVLEAFAVPLPVALVVGRLLLLSRLKPSDAAAELIAAQEMLAAVVDRELKRVPASPPPSTPSRSYTFVQGVGTAPSTAAQGGIDEVVSHDNDKGGTRASEITQNSGGHDFFAVDARSANRTCLACNTTVADYIARGFQQCPAAATSGKKPCGRCGRPGGGHCAACSVHPADY